METPASTSAGSTAHDPDVLDQLESDLLSVEAAIANLDQIPTTGAVSSDDDGSPSPSPSPSPSSSEAIRAAVPEDRFGPVGLPGQPE